MRVGVAQRARRPCDLMLRSGLNGHATYDDNAEGSGHVIAQRAYSHATNNAEGIGHVFCCVAGLTAMRLDVAQRALRPCDLNNTEGSGHAI